MTGAKSFKVAVLDDYQGAAAASTTLGRLSHRCELSFFRDPVRGESLVRRLSDFDAVVLMRERTKIDRSTIEALPRMRLIVSSGRANAALDLDAAAEFGIVVCGTTGWAGVTATVEHTWALILGLARNISAESAEIANGGWMLGVPPQLSGKTLGIVGLGNIGRRIPPVGRALGMDIVAWSRNMTNADATAIGLRRLDHDEFFSSVDVLTIHVKFGERSRHYIGSHELRRMKPGSLLVNTSRGPVVDTEELLRALDTGPLAGAALDVFDEEPLPADHPLRTHPKCLVTPHMGYVSDVSYAEYFTQIAADIEAFVDGHPIRVW